MVRALSLSRLLAVLALSAAAACSPTHQDYVVDSSPAMEPVTQAPTEIKTVEPAKIIEKSPAPSKNKMERKNKTSQHKNKKNKASTDNEAANETVAQNVHLTNTDLQKEEPAKENPLRLDYFAEISQITDNPIFLPQKAVILTTDKSMTYYKDIQRDITKQVTQKLKTDDVDSKISSDLDMESDMALESLD